MGRVYNKPSLFDRMITAVSFLPLYTRNLRECSPYFHFHATLSLLSFSLIDSLFNPPTSHPLSLSFLDFLFNSCLGALFCCGYINRHSLKKEHIQKMTDRHTRTRVNNIYISTLYFFGRVQVGRAVSGGRWEQPSSSQFFSKG